MRVINEITINWHINEACNFGCNYCYAKWSIEKSPFRRIYPAIIDQIAGLAGQPISVLPYPPHSYKDKTQLRGG